MNSISVVVPRMLAAEAGGSRNLTVDGAGIGTVNDLLDALAERYPLLGRRLRDETGTLRRFVNVYVQGEDIRRADGAQTPVQAGQEVMIIQSVAGG